MIDRAKHILKTVFGYDQFISLQQDVIENILRRRDTLVIMPTGGGKSLCYQIPALVLEGLTIVVSPLISLMKDQVEQLTELAVPAVLLNSTLSSQAYRGNVERIRRGEVKLLYVAPETLLKANVLALLKSVPVACLAIDEAHCISEWGPDFRPEYRRLAEVRTRMPDAVCIGLTATATPRVREDIKACLGFDDSGEFVASFNRENLFIRVVPREEPLRQSIGFLRAFPDESGIIYCATRKRVDDLCVALQSAGFSACSYHAGLSETERERNQERFIRDEVPIIVATIAFGMGIDKSNVRFILHCDLPQNIESYYQQIGRAGRDGMRAECLLLFSYSDIRKIRSFIAKKEGLDQRAASLQLKAMVQFAEADGCRRVPLLNYFGEALPEAECAMCDNCLAGERELVDITIPAQKFLSCVKRTGECFGAKHIIDVLRGSKAGKVLQFRHDQLSTYAIGMEYSTRQWQQLARQILHQGLMVQHPEYGGLSLTSKAWDVFNGKGTVFGNLDGATESEKPAEAAAGDQTGDYDRQLFEILRQKRKELAEAANVPPYVIFSDRTLVEMATTFPETPESMLAVHGVGQIKQEKYGSVFMTIIEEYCRDHPAVKGCHVPVTPVRARDRTERERRPAVIGEAFNSGQSVDSLAREWGLKRGTILNHLWNYYQDGHPLRSDGLLPLMTVPDEQRSRVMETFEQLGPELLRPVFEALNEEIGYEDLAVLRLYYLCGGEPAIRGAAGDSGDALEPDPAS